MGIIIEIHNGESSAYNQVINVCVHVMMSFKWVNTNLLHNL